MQKIIKLLVHNFFMIIYYTRWGMSARKIKAKNWTSREFKNLQ